MRTPLPINLDTLLRHRTIEGERVEYKAGWNPESALHAICAFANDFHNLGGGYLVIGVEEKDGLPVLPPKGIDPSRIEGIQKELLNLGHQAIQPQFHPISAPYKVGKATILVVWAPGGETRPYKARVSLAKGSKEWAWFIRLGSSTVRAKGSDERELHGLAASVPFDDRCNQSATLDDLSRRLVGELLDEVGSELAREAPSLSMESLGRQLNVVGGPAESLFPKNVGLLFFNDEPHRFFPATRIDVVFFPEDTGGDRFEEKVFQGPLGHITRDAIAYIERNYLKETVIKHPDRSEAERFWNFPRVAIEEAIVNAVYHRSYEEREPIEVRIDSEALVVLSFPGPDRSVRMEDLRAGKAVSRRYRNRRIGEFLKELDLTEGRSTGVPKILRAMQQNGSPPPQFESDDDRTYFLVRLPVHESADREPQRSTAQATPQVTPQATPQVETVILAVKGEMLRAELMDAVGLKDRMHFVNEYLQPALALDLIEMTIPEKPRSSKQRYRLTDFGRRVQTEVASRGEHDPKKLRVSDAANRIVQKLWSYCHVLRDDGLSYQDYLEQLTFLLFLKMADERAALTGEEQPIPKGWRWADLAAPRMEGVELEQHYRETLRELGQQGGMLGLIFEKAQNKIQDPAKLRQLVVELIGKENWSAMSADVKGDAYEGLLERNAQDVKGGAGQYFTPRAVIDAIVDCVRPQPGEVVADPACGTGGFLLAAHEYLKRHFDLDRDQKRHLRYEALRGVELVPNVARLCGMNLFLHGIGPDGADGRKPPIETDDSLRDEPKLRADVVVTNPPFGKKSSITVVNDEGESDRQALTYNRPDFWTTTSNKQLNFVQHVKSLLKVHGRAAVVVPDNVLFEGGAGETVRRNLLRECEVHTLLRLPTGIFYAQGVKANVLFFDRRPGAAEPWTKTVWVYDLRTNKHFTLKTKRLTRADLDEFVECYRPADRHNRRATWSETSPEGRWRPFGYDEILARDKVSLDLFWLRDESLEDSAGLPEPHLLAQEIADDLRSALAQIEDVLGDLEQRVGAGGSEE